jgi:hypothetical protein
MCQWVVFVVFVMTLDGLVTMDRHSMGLMRLLSFLTFEIFRVGADNVACICKTLIRILI